MKLNILVSWVETILRSSTFPVSREIGWSPTETVHESVSPSYQK
jgi:hypothetical protein